MKSRLPLLLSALTLGFLLNLGHGLLQRARLFTDRGVAQTITVTEQTDAAWSSLLPPRRLYVYTGRIGSTETRIETARRLHAGESYPVLFLRAGDTAAPVRLAGRADRLIRANQSGQSAIWFARGRAGAPAWRNLLADTPLPEAGFYAGWLAVLLVVLGRQLDLGGSRSARRPSLHPVLRPTGLVDPTPGPASPRVVFPAKPPPLPPAAASVETAADEPALTLPRRPSAAANPPPKN